MAYIDKLMRAQAEALARETEALASCETITIWQEDGVFYWRPNVPPAED